MKFFTQVSIDKPRRQLSLGDGILLLGSCFADSVGGKMAASGFNCMVNPFGTLYNPESLKNAVELLDSTTLFTPGDCVPMGAGADRICSFRHHTSFARKTAKEFLSNANDKLLQARDFWHSCNTLVISLGTSFVWYHDGTAVANCLKRPAKEFTRRMLTPQESADCLLSIASTHPEKHLILTVSPIRHLGDGAHANTLSKASLMIAVDKMITHSPAVADYFPASEILLDELRDYRFYAEDLIHPSPAAVTYIWDRFLDTFVLPSDLPAIRANEKSARSLAHRPNL